MSLSTAQCRTMLRAVFEGRRCILASGPVAGMTRQAAELLSLGATDCLLLGSSTGTGVLPEPDDAQITWRSFGIKAPGMMEEIRAYEAALRALPPDALEAIRAFDPDGEALVLASHVSDLTHLDHRPRLGARRPEWAALEDKTIIDALWDRAGVPRAPSRLVRVDDLDACQEASGELERGHGAVWAGDNREGFHGGATCVRRVRGDEDIHAARAFFATRCDSVRIMPFVEGVPCSIHGIVYPEHTIALRPVEMIVLRRPGQAKFLYSGFSTWWDPTPTQREAMRALARRVGDHLRDEVGYRGGFTVDGIMSASGFIPTELNARAGAAMPMLAAGAPELPLALLEICARAGHALPGLDPSALEALILNIADQHRAGGGWTVLHTPHRTSRQYRLVREHPEHDPLHERWVVVPGDEDRNEPWDATLTIGPGSTGGFIRARFAPHMLQPGTRLAPLVAELWAVADHHLDAGIGAVTWREPLEMA